MSVVLYHHPGSLCSQKVRLALAEKGVAYASRVVDIGPRTENYEPWYAQLNPRLVVPTLVHDGKPVTDSARIVRYIDANFDGPPLQAGDEQERAAAERWLLRADGLPLRELSYGTVPGPFGWLLRHSDRLRLRKLERYRAANPELAPLYQARIDDVKQWFECSRNPRKVSELRAQVCAVLDELEPELRTRSFVSGARYGVADVLWTVVLARLRSLGLGGDVDARPSLAAYLARMKQRPSFEQAQVWDRVPWRAILASVLGRKQREKAA